jgi:hypothetical protein
VGAAAADVSLGALGVQADELREVLDGGGRVSHPQVRLPAHHIVVGVVDVDTSIDTTTALADYADGNNPRSATSSNGTDLWIAGGAGVSQLKLTPAEMEPYSQIVPPKQQIGISIGLYQTFFKQLTWAIEYFRGQYTWYQYQALAGDPIVSPRQNINFFNTGLTLVF